jgi:FAD/FMN-containing dehydrogenase
MHDGCSAAEVVTGSGELVSAAAGGDDAALLHALPGSYGSLGLLTAASVPLVAGDEFVAMEYRLFGRAEDMFACMGEARAAGLDFVEGIGFGPACFVACGGRFVSREAVSQGGLGRGPARRFRLL